MHLLPPLPFLRPLKRLVPQTLMARTMLILLLPLLLAFSISTYVFLDRHWEAVTRRLVLSFAGEIRVVISLLQRFPEPEERPWIRRQAQAMGLFIDLSPERTFTLPPAHGRDPLRVMVDRALSTTAPGPYRVDLWSRPHTVAVEIMLPQGRLTVTTLRKRLFSSTTFLVVGWMGGGAVLFFLIALAFLRNQVRAVRRLAAAMDAFGKDRAAPRFKPQGAKEVRLAAVAFNRMRDRLERQITQRMEMLAAVSHDLRTPLTRMRLHLALPPSALEPEDLVAEVVEMERMVEGYLAFARGEAAEDMAPTDLAALVTGVVDRLRDHAVPVTLIAPPSLVRPARAGVLRRAVTNLVENALAHAQGTVAVTLSQGPEGVTLTVDDDGPGIHPERREDMFRAFTRGDEARTASGVGLGLTIARDVVRGHGGEIRLEDSPLGGLRARVWLPH